MAKAPSGGKKQISIKGLFILILIIGLVVVAMPTVVLLIFGLLPTFASILTDKTYQRSQTFCVGALNFAGLFPYLYDLWAGANTMAMAVETLANVFSLLIIYGAAAFGLMIFNTIPPMIGGFLSAVNERRMKALRKVQKNLIEEWGEEVSDSGMAGADQGKKKKGKKEKEASAPPPPPTDDTPQGAKTDA